MKRRFRKIIIRKPRNVIAEDIQSSHDAAHKCMNEHESCPEINEIFDTGRQDV